MGSSALGPRAGEVAERAKGFMPVAEGRALYRAGLEAGRSGLGAFVEVGTYCGKSAVYLGCAARDAGTVLFSVDHHRGSEELQPGWPHHDPAVVDPATGLMDTLPFARRTLLEAGLERHVVLVVGESVTVARYWTGPFALVFIDGGHSAEAVNSDLRAWAPKVAAGGLLAVHDIYPDPADGGQAPYEAYLGLLAGGGWDEVGARGSLRVLRRRRD